VTDGCFVKISSSIGEPAMTHPDTSSVLLERRDGGIAIATLNRPDVRNAINRDTAHRLHNIVRLTEEDESIY
jgi:enoyl-CoA hydratase/carnithine racemase